jgi:hypothetical protein
MLLQMFMCCIGHTLSLLFMMIINTLNSIYTQLVRLIITNLFSLISYMIN